MGAGVGAGGGDTVRSCTIGESVSVSSAGGVYCGSVSSVVEAALWLGVGMKPPSRSSSSELSSSSSSSSAATCRGLAPELFQHHSEKIPDADLLVCLVKARGRLAVWQGEGQRST